MPRLRNTKTNAIVNVPDEKVERMGTDWEPAEKKAPAKKAASSKSEK